MYLSTGSKYILHGRSEKDIIAEVAAAGFDCLDLTLCDMARNDEHVFFKENWSETAMELKSEAEKNGIFYNQAHAPFHMNMNNYLAGGDGEKDVLFRITRSIEVASLVGAKIIIVHPVQCMDYSNYDHKEILEINKQFYGKLAPIAKECGIKIAIENMWRKNIFNNNIITSVCSDPYELALYVDECNKIEDCFVACLDIGHCTLTGVDPAKAIHVLGDRLKALHVHDNDFRHDTHSLPLLYDINFEPIMQALKDINYKGEFTLECDRYFGDIPKELMPDALQFAAKVCRYLIKSVDL